MPRVLRRERHYHVLVPAEGLTYFLLFGFTTKQGFCELCSAAMETLCRQVWEETDDEGLPALVGSPRLGPMGWALAGLA